jgi:FKBP-type peptidyl-prolyl cis-trans isomerase (trigger factor)
MDIKVEKLPNSELKIVATIENSKVAASYENIVEKIINESEIKGFRKGKAPKEVVIEKMDISKVEGEVISDLLKTYYPQILKEKAIFPYSNPKLDVKEFELDKDFVFEAIVATKPEVKVGDYKKIIKKLLEEKKKVLKKENEDKAKEGQEVTITNTELTAEEIVNAISAESKVDLSELMINEETDRLLERFINQIKQLNLNVDSLLNAQNKTYDDLLQDHKKIAENNIKSEFILNEIIKDQKFEASEEEIVEFVNNVGDENLKNQLLNTSEKWYVKSMIEKNKALDYLKNLGKDEK